MIADAIGWKLVKVTQTKEAIVLFLRGGGGAKKIKWKMIKI